MFDAYIAADDATSSAQQVAFWNVGALPLYLINSNIKEGWNFLS